MGTERFTFDGHAGDALAARLDMPEGPHLATAIFAHCFTCGKDISAARRIAARLSGMGIAVQFRTPHIEDVRNSALSNSSTNPLKRIGFAR